MWPGESGAIQAQGTMQRRVFAARKPGDRHTGTAQRFGWLEVGSESREELANQFGGGGQLQVPFGIQHQIRSRREPGVAEQLRILTAVDPRTSRSAGRQHHHGWRPG